MTSPGERPLGRVGRIVLAAFLAIGFVGTIVADDPSGIVLYAAFAGPGTFLAFRRPAMSIGWLLITTGWGLGIGNARVVATSADLLAGVRDPWLLATAWANGTGWTLAFLGLVALVIVFPSGDLPSHRWRWPSRLGVGLLIGMGAIIAVAPTVNVTPVGTVVSIDIPNPIALLPESPAWRVLPSPGSLYASMFGIFVVGVIGLLARFRRSTGLERLQYRWLAASIALVAVTNSLWAIATIALELEDFGFTFALVVVAYTTIPAAIIVAILRYRLYDIDRIISRTISWTLTTGLIGALFAVVVVGLQGVLGPVTGGNTLAVAASTLVAAAIFQPLRRRIQAAVDRRFNRARYDAQRTVDGFAERLRNEMDLGTLRLALSATADGSVNPISSTVWLRNVADSPRPPIS